MAEFNHGIEKVQIGYVSKLGCWTFNKFLPVNNPKYAMVSPFTNSDLEVCRFLISTKVGAYSCRTTLRRALLT